jgi:hypothetical protein
VLGVERWTLRKLNLPELLDRRDDLVKVRPIAGIELGMEEFAISANFKCAAARWNQGQRFNAVGEFEDFRRQTDGLGGVVSNHAVLDRDLNFHWTTSFRSEIIARLETVKKSNGGCTRSCPCEKSTKRKYRSSRISRRCFQRYSWKEPQSVRVNNYRIVMIYKTKIHLFFNSSEMIVALPSAAVVFETSNQILISLTISR